MLYVCDMEMLCHLVCVPECRYLEKYVSSTDCLSWLKKRWAFFFLLPDVTTPESPKNVAESSVVNGGLTSKTKENRLNAAQQVPVQRKKLLKAPTLAELDSSDSEVRSRGPWLTSLNSKFRMPTVSDLDYWSYCFYLLLNPSPFSNSKVRIKINLFSRK